MMCSFPRFQNREVLVNTLLILRVAVAVYRYAIQSMMNGLFTNFQGLVATLSITIQTEKKNKQLSLQLN